MAFGSSKKQAPRLDPKGQPSFTKGTVYVGQDELYEMAMPGSKNYGRSVSGRKPTSLLSLIFALLLGAAAVLLVRYVRFRFMGETGVNETDQQLWMINGAAAFGISLVVGFIFGLRRLSQIIFLALGAFAGIMGFHNLAHWMPDLMARVFSPDWVNAMIAATPPNSMLFRGNFTTF